MPRQITSQDNYIILKDIWDKLDSMDSRLDDRFASMEKRVSVLEGFKVQVLLLVSAGVFIATFLKDYLLSKFFGKGN